MADPPKYSDKEAEAIFQRALSRQLEEQDGFGREELLAAAEEIGLDSKALDRAAEELEVEKYEADIVDTVKKRQRERWLRHGIAFVVAVGGLLTMQALALVGAWIFWVALFWSIAMALHTFNVVRGPSEAAVERERGRRNRHARRVARAQAKAEARRREHEIRHQRARERAERSARRKASDDEFDRLIEDGVTMLLGTAARRVRETARAMDQAPKDSDFNRYVSQQKQRSQGRTRSEPRTGPRVRVDVHEPSPDEAEVSTTRKRPTRAKR